MQYRTVKLPADFVKEVEHFAEAEYRSISQQLLYWAKLGKEVSKSYFTDEYDEEVGKLAVDRYNEENHLAIKVDLDEL